MEFFTPAHPVNTKVAVRLVSTNTLLYLDSEFFIERPDSIIFVWHRSH